MPRKKFGFAANEIRVFAVLVGLGLASVGSPLRAQIPGNPELSDEQDPAGVSFIDTGLIAQRLDTDLKGRFAAVFGQPLPPQSQDLKDKGRSTYFQIYGGPTHVAIVDLVNSRVLSRNPVDGEPQQVLIDDHYVFWKPATVNVINRLALSEDAEKKQLLLSKTLDQAFLIGDDRLGLIVTDSRATRIEVYGRDSLELRPSDSLSQPLRRQSRRFGSAARHLGDDELHLSPRILDQRTGSTKCFVNLAHDVALLDTTKGPVGTFPSSGNHNSWWRRKYDRQDVSTVSGTKLFHLPANTWAVSRTLPLHACMILSGTNRNPARKIEIRELVYGKKVHETVLPRGGPSRTPPRNGIRFTGDKVAVAMFDEVAVVDIPRDILKEVREPLRLLHPRIPVCDTESPLEFHLEARGGEAPYTFSLGSDSKGATVDPQSGRVSIDLPRVFNEQLERVSVSKDRPFQMPPSSYSEDWEDDLSAETLFTRRTGVDVPPGAFPTVLPLVLQATDSGGHLDSIVVQVVAMAPKAALRNANVKAREAQQLLQETRRAKAIAAVSARGNPDGVGQRLDDLERRMRSIETRLEKVLKLLEEQSEGNERE